MDHVGYEFGSQIDARVDRRSIRDLGRWRGGEPEGATRCTRAGPAANRAGRRSAGWRRALLEAVDARPRLSLALLAYCAAQLLAQVPITPGGLGVVEAGMTGGLGLAGVPAAAAAVATLAYRLASYWLPLPAGAVAWLVHRHRFGTADELAGRAGVAT